MNENLCIGNGRSRSPQVSNSNIISFPSDINFNIKMRWNVIYLYLTGRISSLPRSWNEKHEFSISVFIASSQSVSPLISSNYLAYLMVRGTSTPNFIGFGLRYLEFTFLVIKLWHIRTFFIHHLKDGLFTRPRDSTYSATLTEFYSWMTLRFNQSMDSSIHLTCKSQPF